MWNKLPPAHHQTPLHNIVCQRSGAHRLTETMSVYDTFKCILSNEMIDIVLRHTNKKARKVYEAYNINHPPEKQRKWIDITEREFDAFLGLFITSGVNHSNVENIMHMWKKTSYPLYRVSMGINRFWNILRFIRFDDANTRQERQQIDKAAHTCYMGNAQFKLAKILQAN